MCEIGINPVVALARKLRGRRPNGGQLSLRGEGGSAARGFLHFGLAYEYQRIGRCRLSEPGALLEETRVTALPVVAFKHHYKLKITLPRRK